MSPAFMVNPTVIVCPSSERVLDSIISMEPMGPYEIDLVISRFLSQRVLDFTVVPPGSGFWFDFPSVVCWNSKIF